MPQRSRRVMIFGASGNSGRYLLRRFVEDGWSVTGAGRTAIKPPPGVDYHQFDIRHADQFQQLPKNFDLVINLAGVQPSIMPQQLLRTRATELREYFSVNVVGTSHILNWVVETGPDSYIFANSHREIEMHWSDSARLSAGLSPAINFDGDHAFFALTKSMAGSLGQSIGRLSGTRMFNLRLPMLFMVPESPTYLKEGVQEIMPFLKLIKAAANNECLEVWGDPQLRRDYVHIENLFRMMLLCYRSNLKEGLFNVGTGEGVTTEAFVHEIGAQFSPTGEAPCLTYNPQVTTYKNAVYDLTEEVSSLGYSPILVKEMIQLLRAEIQATNAFARWGWAPTS